MDELQAARLRLKRALQEHLETVEALAAEAGAIAQQAKHAGATNFASVLQDLARFHRAATIQYEARIKAMEGDEDQQG